METMTQQQPTTEPATTGREFDAVTSISAAS